MGGYDKHKRTRKLNTRHYLLRILFKHINDGLFYYFYNLACPVDGGLGAVWIEEEGVPWGLGQDSAAAVLLVTGRLLLFSASRILVD